MSGRKVVRTSARFATTTRGLLALSEWLSTHQCQTVALEATGAQFALVLANPGHVRAIPGRKSDMNDAAWLADLVAHGLIRGSFVPPTAIQELRDLTRTRKPSTAEDARGRQSEDCELCQRPSRRERTRHPSGLD
jgi:transposase